VVTSVWIFLKQVAIIRSNLHPLNAERPNHMPHTFTVPLKGRSPSDLVAKAKEAAVDGGADFAGDERTGTFSGNGVVANYEIRRDDVLITLKSKPLIAPWSFVETRIREFFD
jgi:hypothetical protein